MELTLGPVLFNWKKEELLGFYQAIAESPVDTVYMGEVVCTKRRSLAVRDIEDIAATLSKRGKRVILSTPAIVAGKEELRYIEAILGLPYPVEANDMSVVNMAEGGHKEVVGGPHLEVYNHVAVEFLMAQGIRRIAFPVELPAETIKYMIERTGIFGEIVAHGRLPLAFSWRCYTLRAQGLKRKHCQNQCSQWPDGMDIRTLDGERVFNMNGTSILSAKPLALAGLMEETMGVGIKALRIYPHHSHTPGTIEIYREAIDGNISTEEAMEGLRRLYGEDLVNGWFSGGPGKDYHHISKTREVMQW